MPPNLTTSDIREEGGAMASTEAQKRASMKYMKEKTHPFTMRFSPVDEDLWQHLQSQPNKQGYVKRLIREDMERRR